MIGLLCAVEVCGEECLVSLLSFITMGRSVSLYILRL